MIETTYLNGADVLLMVLLEGTEKVIGDWSYEATGSDDL